MYKYNFMCFSVTFPYKPALYLDHIHPPFCLPFSSSLMPFPFLSISSLIFQAITLGISIYEKNIHLCFHLVCLLSRAVLQLQPFPPMKVPFVCSLLMLCAPMGPHLLVEIPPHHCEIWIFTWIQFACLLSGCNIYADRGHVAFFCVIASFMLSTGNGPL